MQRYSFYVRSGDTVWLTDVHDLPTAEAARERARAAARELSRTAALSGVAGIIDQRIEVVDQAGETILVVPVGRASGPAGN